MDAGIESRMVESMLGEDGKEVGREDDDDIIIEADSHQKYHENLSKTDDVFAHVFCLMMRFR